MQMEIRNEETSPQGKVREQGLSVTKRMKQHTGNGTDRRAYNAVMCTAENMLITFIELATVYKTLLKYDTIHYCFTPCHRLSCYLLLQPPQRRLPFTWPCLSQVCYQLHKFPLQIKAFFFIVSVFRCHIRLNTSRLATNILFCDVFKSIRQKWRLHNL